MSEPVVIIPIVVHIDIHITPSKVLDFLTHFQKVYTQVADEPQCIFFDFSANQDEPGHFRVVETWNESREWFESVQLEKDYYKHYVEATQPLWSKPPVISYFGHVPGTELFEIKPSAIPQ